MAITKRARYETLRRDGYACRYCGAKAPDVILTVDHVVPVALGGTDALSNLAAACGSCNTGKSSSNPDDSLVTDVANDAQLWDDVMQAPPRCGHCPSCLDNDAWRTTSDDSRCWLHLDQSEYSDLDECEACGKPQCALGQARVGGLLEGYEAGEQHQWTDWYGSYERLQFFALTRVVDNTDRYGRAL